MNPRSQHPLIYEINTWVWLNELSQQHGKPITLACVPDSEWKTIAQRGFDTVWLMGVSERSPVGVQIARDYGPFQEEFPQILPNYHVEEDLVGSPYCVRRYRVDEHLGGPEGLATARKQFASFGLKLLLDFVPNHVAPDHPWTVEHPEYFVQGSAQDLAEHPEAFYQVGKNILARGKDPYFAPWPEVVQLNAFSPGLRQAVIATLNDIASQADGVRCDMSMLLTTPVFARTWGERAGTPPAREYWREVIPAVKAQHPEFIFIAEAYWDLEWELQQQGFDYCYDKRLYDRLVNDDARAVRNHLSADIDYQKKLLRFIENHDEPRAAATFSPEKSVPPRSPSRRCLERDSSTTVRSRAARFVYPSFSVVSQRRRRIVRSATSTTVYSMRSARRECMKGSGNSARRVVGPTTIRTRTSCPGAGETAITAYWSSSICRLPRHREWSGFHGTIWPARAGR